ncbi:MAG: DUF4091 domain-containing protein [Kiritimatiellae bacterium]|nr:DUF4091 domain-containing protein [Kiritimatiellia bacterium]
MKCSLRDSLEWLYPDSTIDGEPITSLECDAPAGGVADVNVLVTDIAPDKPLRFSSDTPDGEFFRLIDVPVECNTGPEAFAEREGGPRNKFVTRRAPFRVFDAMEPLSGDSLTPADVEQLTGKSLTSGEATVALRFRVRLGYDEASGDRRIAIRVSQDGEEALLTFDVHVHAVGLTPVGRDSFPYTNWISFSAIAESHGIEQWTEAYFDMVGRYARLMAYGRQNMFLLPLSVLFEAKDGKPVLNVERLERLVRIFTGMVRRYMPGLPILDATQDPDMAGAVDAWCPLVNHYESAKDKFDAAKARGDLVWYYTCCCPGGKFMNRLLDNELLRPLYLGWGGALYNLDGYLHWGLNYRSVGQNPFRKNVIQNWGGGTNALPAGDTHIVYPGRDGPWPSARLEAMRQGFEDRELLERLRSKAPERIEPLIRAIVRGFADYTPDVALYRRTRRELLSLCLS